MSTIAPSDFSYRTSIPTIGCGLWDNNIYVSHACNTKGQYYATRTPDENTREANGENRHPYYPFIVPIGPMWIHGTGTITREYWWNRSKIVDQQITRANLQRHENLIRDLLGDRGSFRYVEKNMSLMYARSELTLKPVTEWHGHTYPWSLNVKMKCTIPRGMDVNFLFHPRKSMPDNKKRPIWDSASRSILPNQTVSIDKPAGSKTCYLIPSRDMVCGDTNMLAGVPYEQITPTLSIEAGSEGGALIRTYQV